MKCATLIYLTANSSSKLTATSTNAYSDTRFRKLKVFASPRLFRRFYCGEKMCSAFASSIFFVVVVVVALVLVRTEIYIQLMSRTYIQ